MIVYKTEIISIGEEAENFLKDKMMILFGNNTPEDLQPYIFQIKLDTIKKQINPGMIVSINNQNYTITAVGNMVNSHLENIGHITIKFDGATTTTLPGTLHLEAKDPPNINVGSHIKILNN